MQWITSGVHDTEAIVLFMCHTVVVQVPTIPGGERNQRLPLRSRSSWFLMVGSYYAALDHGTSSATQGEAFEFGVRSHESAKQRRFWSFSSNAPGDEEIHRLFYVVLPAD